MCRRGKARETKRPPREGTKDTYHLRMNIAAVLVDASERERDGFAALRGRGCLDVGGGKKDEDASKETRERECELHGEDRPRTL